ncbi:MAG: hypothetical protein ABL984_10165 [Pyrinomonadaceae bacterium]
MADNISAMPDAELKQLGDALFATVSVAPITFGLTAAYATALQAETDDFGSKLEDHNAAQTTARANRVDPTL